MNSIHILTTVESDTLHLPQLQALIGKPVEITIVERPTHQGCLESRETFLGDRADTPHSDAAAIQALRNDEQFAKFWPFLDSRSPDAIDVDAIVNVRAESPT